MNSIRQAVIFCGGLGTRLGKITKNLPKPMVEVAGKPFLEHLIIQLKKNGIKEVLLLVGYKNEIKEITLKMEKNSISKLNIHTCQLKLKLAQGFLKLKIN